MKTVPKNKNTNYGYLSSSNKSGKLKSALDFGAAGVTSEHAEQKMEVYIISLEQMSFSEFGETAVRTNPDSSTEPSAYFKTHVNAMSYAEYLSKETGIEISDITQPKQNQP